MNSQKTKDRSKKNERSGRGPSGWGVVLKSAGWVPTCHPVLISKFSIFQAAEETSLKSATRIFNHRRVMDELCVLAALGAVQADGWTGMDLRTNYVSNPLQCTSTIVHVSSHTPRRQLSCSGDMRTRLQDVPLATRVKSRGVRENYFLTPRHVVY